jgi:hypothetical protein
LIQLIFLGTGWKLIRSVCDNIVEKNRRGRNLRSLIDRQFNDFARGEGRKGRIGVGKTLKS